MCPKIAKIGLNQPKLILTPKLAEKAKIGLNGPESG